MSGWPPEERAALARPAAGRRHPLAHRLDLFGERAIAWFARALRMRRPGTGIGGFRAFTPGDDGGMAWRDDPGFLTGDAGGALALLGAITDVAPDWDRALLLS